MTFGEQLINIRKQKGITQEQLAEAMGITRQGISSWERNLTMPDIESIKQLSQILEYDFAAFQSSEIDAAKAKKKFPTNLLLAFIAGILATLLVVMVIIPAFNKPQPESYSVPITADGSTGQETVEWFAEKKIPVSGKPYVVVSFSENPVLAEKDPGYINGYGWNYTVYFTEYNGLDFYPETFTMYYFTDETHSFTVEYSKETLTDWWGEAKIPARGQQCVGAGDPLQDIIGMGILLDGKDANGEQMSFQGFVELSQTIKE